MTGKTRKLVDAFVANARVVGPRRVAAITYTRSAAEELRLRLGDLLSIGRDPTTLRRELPFVGTIHSLCYKLIDRPDVADWKRLKEFYKSMGEDPKDIPTMDDMEDMEDLAEKTSGVSMMRSALSASRHRKVSLREALFDIVPPTQIAIYRPEYIESLARQYEDWKRDNRYVDYDDMLDAGKHLTLPVDVLIDDECQDQSPLMWDVVDAWAKPVRVAIFGGDSFQALYFFAGGDPHLFMNHPGDWKHLTVSHRVSDETAEYARLILTSAGWHLDNLWGGVGGKPVDGTSMYIARTNALANVMADELMEQGTPFVTLKRYGPWDSAAARAYRLIEQLDQGDMIRSSQIPSLVSAATFGALTKDRKAQIESLAKQDHLVDKDCVEKVLGFGLNTFPYWAPRIAEYLDRVVEVHGRNALYVKPKVSVGTCHGAKGREADTVYLARDWGNLPGKMAATPGEPSLREACVAYVAVSRHRSKLHLVDLGMTIPYRFPDRRES